MGKKKRMVLLVLGIIILGIAIYQYTLQKAFAQKAFETYIDEQGIDPDNIAIKKLVKDWKRGKAEKRSAERQNRSRDHPRPRADRELL